MEKLEEILLDLENDLEKKGRKLSADDQKASQIRLMGYLEGVQDMRIEVSRYFRKNKLNDTVQESEEEKEGYNTDLIRVIVQMHKEMKEIHKKANAILMIVNQFKIFRGNENAGEIFGKEVQ